MHSIRTTADLLRRLDEPMDPPLRRLLELRRDQLLTDGADLADIAHFVVVSVGDPLASIEREAGVPFSLNLVDGTRPGEPGYAPSFEFVARHRGGWLEAVLVMSDDGFSTVLLVPDRIGVDPPLLRLLRREV